MKHLIDKMRAKQVLVAPTKGVKAEDKCTPILTPPKGGSGAIKLKKKKKKHRKNGATGNQIRQFKRGRLPDGSSFAVTYLADREVWTGSLYIHDPSGELVFTAENKGVFWLLEQLDNKYRLWLNTKDLPPAEKPVE
jgi:hypothetical protein